MYRIRNTGLCSMCVADLCELSGYEEVRRSSAHEASLQDATHVSTRTVPVHSCAKAARRNLNFSQFCGSVTFWYGSGSADPTSDLRIRIQILLFPKYR
jgi:hypothetical protein